ncbi:MAG: FliI/YscN family ATPase [Proteobacteria bacterium]|nr:FliI/YscN family ATPase [Pseudomonadota bacterium]
MKDSSSEKNKVKTKTSFSNASELDLNLSGFYKKLRAEEVFPSINRGSIKQVSGLVMKARLPNARLGEICTIETHSKKSIKAQVVGFDDDDVFLTPLDPLEDIGPKTPIISRGKTLRVGVGPELLGRVINCLGEPIDHKGPINAETTYPVKHHAPEALDRKRISRILPVGVRAIDALTTIGEGQRMGVFSSAGVGKSSLLGMIARNSKADVNVVALVGERGREVLDFLEDNLGEAGLSRSVVVVSTSDEPPLRRILAAYTATAIAEYFRDRGKAVMLLMDSVTRFGRALREIALSLGEPPARQGFPPSVFAALPELLERAGSTSEGSITAFYTILLSTEQIEDPLGEEIRAILDGHLYLSSKLSYSQHFPAIDILKSNSRVMQSIVTKEHKEIAEKIKKTWSIYEENKDIISIGAYKPGSDSSIDNAINKRNSLVKFLVQAGDERDNFDVTIEKAKAIF